MSLVERWSVREVLEISWVGSGWVNRFSNLAVRVGDPALPDPREVRPTRPVKYPDNWGFRMSWEGEGVLR